MEFIIATQYIHVHSYSNTRLDQEYMVTIIAQTIECARVFWNLQTGGKSDEKSVYINGV